MLGLRRTRSLLRHREEIVDVLDRAKRFLPQLELGGGFQLRKAGVETVLKDIGIGRVDRMKLVHALGHVYQVQGEVFAETAELDLALVLQAELEGFLGNSLHERSCYATYEHANAVKTNRINNLTRVLSALSLIWSPLTAPSRILSRVSLT